MGLVCETLWILYSTFGMLIAQSNWELQSVCLFARLWFKFVRPSFGCLGVGFGETLWIFVFHVCNFHHQTVGVWLDIVALTISILRVSFVQWNPGESTCEYCVFKSIWLFVCRTQYVLNVFHYFIDWLQTHTHMHSTILHSINNAYFIYIRRVVHWLYIDCVL